ncbi:MAG: hypothetical protein AABX48_01645 [Nanoarchaeota archaeon]
MGVEKRLGIEKRLVNIPVISRWGIYNPKTGKVDNGPRIVYVPKLLPEVYVHNKYAPKAHD